MSGHNKWSKIRHKKAASDAHKSKVFSKYSKLITIEAKKCRGDINSPSLRAVIEKAKRENMPNDNIDRAIKKAIELSDSINEAIFETYGPGGVGIVIVAFTDNNNRTSNEIRSLLTKNGYQLAGQGSVMWAFTRDPETQDLVPNNTIELADDDSIRLAELIGILDEHDDIEEIYTNAS